MKVLRALVVSTFVLSAGTFGAGTFAAADPAEHEDMRASQFRADHSLAGLIQKLDLTEAQRENIREILDASQSQRQALREQHHEAMKASLSILPDDPNAGRRAISLAFRPLRPCRSPALPPCRRRANAPG